MYKFTKFACKLVVGALLLGGVISTSPAASTAATWEGSGYKVLQYSTQIGQVFYNKDEAINFAKQYNHTRVFGISSGEVYWDNIKVQVFQGDRYLNDFGSRLGGMQYAQNYSNTRVVDLEDGTVYWTYDQFYTVRQKVLQLGNTLESKATQLLDKLDNLDWVVSQLPNGLNKQKQINDLSKLRKDIVEQLNMMQQRKASDFATTRAHSYILNKGYQGSIDELDQLIYNAQDINFN